MLKNKIIDLIKSNLNVQAIKLQDLSHQHRNHPKSHDGSHFILNVISDDFINVPIIERHRMIYKILEKFLKKEIHALSISAKTISECNEKEASRN
tara:strand:+ start:1575 stop:1859 length:285 start_codon:yes stop_codon:yes gene_type:complete